MARAEFLKKAERVDEIGRTIYDLLNEFQDIVNKTYPFDARKLGLITYDGRETVEKILAVAEKIVKDYDDGML